MPYLRKIATQGFHLSILLPFIAPFPLDSDTQYLPTVLALGFLIIKSFETGFVKFQKSEILFFALVIYVVFHYVYLGFGGLRNVAVLGSAFIVLYALRITLCHFDYRILNAAALINTAGVIWHSMSPRTFVPFAEILVRKVKIPEPVYRGYSGFAAEPSFAAILTILYVMLGVHLLLSRKMTAINLLFLIGASLIVIILSRSGSGFVLFPLVAMCCLNAFFVRGKYIVFSVLLFLIAVLVVAVEGITESRGVVLLQNAITEPNLLIEDGSIQERLRAISLGFYSAVDRPFGLGDNDFHSGVEETATAHRLDEIYSKARPIYSVVPSAVGKYTILFGYPFLVIFSFVLISCFRFGFTHIISWILGVLLLLFSFSLAFPPSYVLILLPRLIGKHNYTELR